MSTANNSRSTGSALPAIESGVSLGERLVSLGVPVFWARISGPEDGPKRQGWESTEPDMTEVGKWRPGLALCARMGVVFDAFDWDPRNDPDEAGLAGLRKVFEKYNPTVYLKVRTPSGGWHWWVASLGGRAHKISLPGVDYLGDGRGAFIPPTERRAKNEHGLSYGSPLPYEVTYENLDAPIEVCDGLREVLAAPGQNGHHRTTDEAVREMLDAKPGDRNDSLRDGVWKLQDSGLSRETIITIVAPALREAGWKAKLGSLENDIRDILKRNKNAMSEEDRQDLSELAGMGPRRKPGRTKKVITGKELLAGMRNGTWLDRQEFPPLQYAVPGVVPEGVVLLAGSPKVGKSTIVRRIGLECARGGKVFGIKCERRNVLYLALEDDDPSMQASCWELLGDDPIPARFSYLTDIEPGRLIRTVAAYLTEHPRSLAIVDTLGRAMEPADKGETTYDRDYRIMTDLKSVGREHPGSTIIVNHHSRKAKSDDFVDAVSGTNAIAGAADTIVVLTRKRGTTDGVWNATSRKPMDDAEYAMILERPFGWRLNGSNLQEATANATLAQNNLGERSKEVISYVSQHPDGVTMVQISDATGIPANQLKYYVSTACERGDIRKIKRGLYGPSGPIRIGDK